jgi:hypothetical protein
LVRRMVSPSLRPSLGRPKQCPTGGLPFNSYLCSFHYPRKLLKPFRRPVTPLHDSPLNGLLQFMHMAAFASDINGHEVSTVPFNHRNNAQSSFVFRGSCKFCHRIRPQPRNLSFKLTGHAETITTEHQFNMPVVEQISCFRPCEPFWK